MPLQSCFPSKRNEVRSVGQILFFLCFSSIRAVCAPIYYWIGYSRFVGYSVVACMLLVTVSILVMFLDIVPCVGVNNL